MLLDHFHSPLADRRHWEGFHQTWAVLIATDLNKKLPPGWHAEPELEFGIKVDVGVTEDEIYSKLSEEQAGSHWQPPSPTLTMPFVFTTDRLEVRVYNNGYGPSLMGAIELVSPANKDRPEHRDQFVSKCRNIVSEGAGLMVVDIVTTRQANLHREFLERGGKDSLDSHAELYASAYAPTHHTDETQNLRVWYQRLQIGEPLPVMPLHLRVGPTMPIDLQTTYRQVCESLRI